MTTPSASDIAALDVTGNKDLAHQWPSLVRSILYLQDTYGRALGLGGAPQTLSLNNDSVPTSANSVVLLLNPQAGTSDSLKWISINNYLEGQLVFIGIANEGTSGAYRSIKVINGAGGSGAISLSTGTNVYLNKLRQVIVLQLRSSTWVEVFRAGSEFERYITSSAPNNPPLIDESEAVLGTDFNYAGSFVYYSRHENLVSLRGRFYSGVANNLITTSYSALGGGALAPFYRPISTIDSLPAVLVDHTSSLTYLANVTITSGGAVFVAWNTAINHPGSIYFQVNYSI